MSGAGKPLGRLWPTVARDAILAWRNGQIAVALAIMAIMVALVFLLPAKIEGSPSYLLLDESTDGWLARAAGTGAESGAWTIHQKRGSFEGAMQERKAAIGIAAGGDSSRPSARIYAGASVPEENVAIVRATVTELARRARGQSAVGRFVVHTSGAARVEVPLNLKGVPIFVVFEVGILGFLLVAVFLFQEKAEGTLKAYRASPGGTAVYVTSKTLLFVGISVVYGSGVIAAAVAAGARPDFGALLAVIAASSATMTLLGLGFATFFQNLSQWFFPGIAVLVVNLVPMIAYAVPGFDPAWIALIPSYDAIFMTREALFSPGSGVDTAGAARLAMWLALSSAFAYVTVRTRLLRDTR